MMPVFRLCSVCRVLDDDGPDPGPHWPKLHLLHLWPILHTAPGLIFKKLISSYYSLSKRSGFPFKKIIPKFHCMILQAFYNLYILLTIPNLVNVASLLSHKWTMSSHTPYLFMLIKFFPPSTTPQCLEYENSIQSERVHPGTSYSIQPSLFSIFTEFTFL